MSKPIIRTVVISEDEHERAMLMQVLDGVSGIDVVAEVTLVCQMGNQAGHVDADAVILDIDRYPRAGTLSLVQAQATFPDARILMLVRDPDPRFPKFLKASGASCCIDKDDHGFPAQVLTTLQAIGAGGNGNGELRRGPSQPERSSFKGLVVPRRSEPASAFQIVAGD